MWRDEVFWIRESRGFLNFKDLVEFIEWWVEVVNDFVFGRVGEISRFVLRKYLRGSW